MRRCKFKAEKEVKNGWKRILNGTIDINFGIKLQNQYKVGQKR